MQLLGLQHFAGIPWPLIYLLDHLDLGAQIGHAALPMRLCCIALDCVVTQKFELSIDSQLQTGIANRRWHKAEYT